MNFELFKNNISKIFENKGKLIPVTAPLSRLSIFLKLTVTIIALVPVTTLSSALINTLYTMYRDPI